MDGAISYVGRGVVLIGLVGGWFKFIDFAVDVYCGVRDGIRDARKPRRRRSASRKETR